VGQRGLHSVHEGAQIREVHRTEYRNLPDARARIGRFLESIDNDRRMHLSLSYRSPNEFERSLAPGLPDKEAA
jgi:hypothetical protein